MAGWISTIADTINTAFSTVRKPLAAIPPLLLICEIKNRPGLSAIELTANIIRRLPEIGIKTEANVDGSPNKTLGLIRIQAEETIKHFKNCARITTVPEPGTMTFNGVAASPSGPAPCTAVNTGLTAVYGLME